MQLNSDQDHLWPVIFEQSYNFLEKQDIFTLSKVSKSFNKNIIETERIQVATTVEKTFFNFLQSINISNPNIRFTFKPCQTFFDVRIEKIKKIVDFHLILCKLSDNCKSFLKQKLSENPNQLIFKKTIESLKTEDELAMYSRTYDPEEPQPLQIIIQNLINQGQIKKASSLVNKHHIDLDLTDIESNHQAYTLIHYPFLTDSERKMIIRHLFQKIINCSSEIIVAVITALTTRCDGKAGPCKLAIESHLFSEMSKFIKEENSSKFSLLKEICDRFTWLEEMNKRIENIHAHHQINLLLEDNNFQAAFEFVSSLRKSLMREVIYTSIVEKNIKWLLSNHNFQEAIDLTHQFSCDRSRNSSLQEIAKKAIEKNELKIALTTTSFIKDNDTADLLFFEILKRQKIDCAIVTFKSIKKKEEFLQKVCLILPEIIEKHEIPKALEIIHDLPNTKARLEALNLIVYLLFPEYKHVTNWIEFTNEINSFTKRLEFLNIFFKGFQLDTSKDFLNHANESYLFFSKIFKKNNLLDSMNAITVLANKWQRRLVLELMVNHLFPNKAVVKWLERAHNIFDPEKKRMFLNDFEEAMKFLEDETLLTESKIELFKKSYLDAKKALDIANAIPFAKIRLELFKLISLQLTPNDEIEIAEEALLFINEMKDHIERRESLYDLLNK